MKFNLGLANIESVHSRIFSKSKKETLQMDYQLIKRLKKLALKMPFSWNKKTFLIKNLNIVLKKVLMF